MSWHQNRVDKHLPVFGTMQGIICQRLRYEPQRFVPNRDFHTNYPSLALTYAPPPSYARTQTCIYIYTQTQIHPCVSVCLCVGLKSVCVCACVCVCRCLDISIHIYDTIAAGCAHAPVYVQFVHSRWGRGRCFNQSKQSTCRLAVGVLYERGLLSCDFSIFDAGGSVRECMCVHTDLTCKRGSVGQSEGLFVSRSSVRSRTKPRTLIHLDFSYIDP